MRSLRAAVAGTAAALLLLAGCGDDPDPKDPDSTWTPTSTPESPTTAATQAPVEPALPEAATKPTEAGARAFIEYYWELINYAQVTGDVKALKRVSGATCAGCRRAIEAVNGLYRGGGHAEGGEYHLVIERIREVTAGNHSFQGIEAHLTVRNAEQLIVRGDGSSETSAPKPSSFLNYLIWTDGAWRVDILEPR